MTKRSRNLAQTIRRCAALLPDVGYGSYPGGTKIVCQAQHYIATDKEYVLALPGASVTAKEGSKVVAMPSSIVTALRGAKVIALSGSKVIALTGSYILCRVGAEVQSEQYSLIEFIDDAVLVAFHQVISCTAS